MLLMIERNVDLERELSAARKEIAEKQKEIDLLTKCVSRPVFSTFSDQQIELLAELWCSHMQDFQGMKKVYTN